MTVAIDVSAVTSITRYSQFEYWHERFLIGKIIHCTEKNNIRKKEAEYRQHWKYFNNIGNILILL